MKKRYSLLYATIAMIVMIIMYVLTATGFMGDNPVGQTATYEQPLVVPAGYAFSIWSVIYLGIIAFPIYQWIMRPDYELQWQKVQLLYGINVIGNGLWLVLASYNWLWLSVAVILVMLWSLLQITTLIHKIKEKGTPVSFWFEELVFRIYFAWITLATALNISAALNFYEWDGWGISKITWSIIVLTVAAVIAGYITWKRRDTFYGMVVIWAFAALVVRHFGEQPVLSYFSIGIVMTFVLLLFIRRPLSAVA